jgi:hypothetical protein
MLNQNIQFYLKTNTKELHICKFKQNHQNVIFYKIKYFSQKHKKINFLNNFLKQQTA